MMSNNNTKKMKVIKIECFVKRVPTMGSSYTFYIEVATSLPVKDMCDCVRNEMWDDVIINLDGVGPQLLNCDGRWYFYREMISGLIHVFNQKITAYFLRRRISLYKVFYFWMNECWFYSTIKINLIFRYMYPNTQ